MHRTMVKHRIPFHDIDIMEIAWHGHYLKYFELARTQFCIELGIDWPTLRTLGFAMPVVKVEVDYRKPLCYNEEYLVTAACDDLFLPALTLKYEIVSAQNGNILTRGFTKQLYLETHTKEIQFAVPETIAHRMQSHMRLNEASPK